MLLFHSWPLADYFSHSLIFFCQGTVPKRKTDITEIVKERSENESGKVWLPLKLPHNANDYPIDQVVGILHNEILSNAKHRKEGLIIQF